MYTPTDKIHVHIAGPFGYREELMRWPRQRLLDDGFVVTSRWLMPGFREVDGKPSAEKIAQSAKEDYEDVTNSHIVVNQATELGDIYASGGRHVETGMAIALGIPVIVVGRRENSFHYLADTEVFWTNNGYFEWPAIRLAEEWPEAFRLIGEYREKWFGIKGSGDASEL